MEKINELIDALCKAASDCGKGFIDYNERHAQNKRFAEARAALVAHIETAIYIAPRKASAEKDAVGAIRKLVKELGLEAKDFENLSLAANNFRVSNEPESDPVARANALANNNDFAAKAVRDLTENVKGFGIRTEALAQYTSLAPTSFFDGGPAPITPPTKTVPLEATADPPRLYEEGSVFGAIEDVIAGSQAAFDVIKERARQINEEGWTAVHDDAHTNGEMAKAAACYAVQSEDPQFVLTIGGYSFLHKFWPWQKEWWKPTDRRRNLVKAAALLIAEIERIDRAAEYQAEGGAK